MDKQDLENCKIFAEFAVYEEDDAEEKKEAENYLNLWKKFILKRLSKDCYNVNLIDEQWVYRDALYSGSLALNATMALKLYVRADFHYQLE